MGQSLPVGRIVEVKMTGVQSRGERIREQRLALPDETGVYLFRNAAGKVIYVGKANSIRSRVSSHFNAPAGRRQMEMIAGVDQIECVVVQTEAEALLTEQAFIRRHKPRYNILLRDDKSYPFIGVSIDEKFPRVYMTREKRRRNRLYFGPFASSRAAFKTVEMLNRVFMFRSCDGTEPGRRSGSPCLDFHIERCTGPCIGEIEEVEYRARIEDAIAFLSGRHDELQQRLQADMELASEEQRYEDAARARNGLRAAKSVLERQRVAGIAAGSGSLDVIAVCVGEKDANAQVLQVRDGFLTDRLSYYLDSAGGTVAEVAEAFVVQHYEGIGAIPGLIVVQPELAGTPAAAAIAAAFSEQRGSRVEVGGGERGDRRQLIEMAERNAKLALGQERLRAERNRQQRAASLDGLAEALGLDAPPLRIECFDISHLMGTETVASMVVFEAGVPSKSDYRSFRIRDEVAGAPDDFASMEQVLDRRLKRWESESDVSPHDSKKDKSFAALPSLIVIDGGPGQLSAGLRSLEKFTDQGVAVISLAKRIEEIFVPGRSHPILLPHDSPELQLLQRVRDEAHRFAITHHRKRRSKTMTDSALDGLPGVGPTRRAQLLRYFGSAEAVFSASRAELESVPGLPGKVARDLHSHINKTYG
ncbi:MAG: excinuclease ABC subunit UvrC [Actinomycetes bacterium]